MKSKKVKPKTKGKTKVTKKKSVVSKSVKKRIAAQKGGKRQEAKDAMLYDARQTLSLMSTLLMGYLTKVVSATSQTGDEPLTYSNYIKNPLMSFFADFEDQMSR